MAVLELRMVLVARPVEVAVREDLMLAVPVEEAEEVLVEEGDFVSAPVARTDLVEVVLGDTGRVAAAERVCVVVFVEVLDWVLVLVGTTPRSRGYTAISEIGAAPTIAASRRSQRMAVSTHMI